MSLLPRCSGTCWIKLVSLMLASSQQTVIGASLIQRSLTHALMILLRWLGKYSQLEVIFRGSPLTNDWLNMWCINDETSAAFRCVFAYNTEWIGLVLLIWWLLYKSNCKLNVCGCFSVGLSEKWQYNQTLDKLHMFMLLYSTTHMHGKIFSYKAWHFYH